MIEINASDPYVYVSPVAGHVVSRYGSGSRTTNAQPIGHTRDPQTGAMVLVDEQVVERIPGAEVRRYLREYSRAVEVDGALVVKTEADYKAWLQLVADRAKKAAEDAEAKAAPAAEADPVAPPAAPAP